MNLKIESNAFTQLQEMTGIAEANIGIYDYIFENNTLKGNVKINGEYYNKNNEQNKISFENIIPFEVVFTKENVEIEKIEINSFEYYEVAGRGIEASFNINIDYDIKETRIVNKEMEENEKFKEEVTLAIDELLSEKLEVVEDNFLETAEIIAPISEEKQIEEVIKKRDVSSTLKIIYHKENENIKELCKKHNLSYEEVLIENQKYNFNNSHRIIVKKTNGCN